MYGEGASTFYRLQIEIMTKSDNPSLFDWTGKPGANSLLASSPACFDPFVPPIVDPVRATMRVAKMLHKIPFLPQVRRGIDQLNVGLFNLQERVGVNAQYPANYMAGAKILCHGLEYSVFNVEETKVMSEARAAGRSGVFQYHIIVESHHPIAVTLGEPIGTGFGYGRVVTKCLCIFRVWDQSLAMEWLTVARARAQHCPCLPARHLALSMPTFPLALPSTMQRQGWLHDGCVEGRDPTSATNMPP